MTTPGIRYALFESVGAIPAELVGKESSNRRFSCEIKKSYFDF